MPLAQTINPSAPTGRTGQGSGINNREDLSNELTMLKATKFPITLALKAGKATSILSEWPVDKLAAPQTDGVVEGQDADSFEDPFSDAARLQTRQQRIWRKWMVSEEQEAVTSAGNFNAAQAKMKKMLELKRDKEAILASDNDAVTPAAGVAGKTRGLGKWISTAPGSDVPEDYRTPTASILTAAPTEQTFYDVLGSIFSITGEVEELLVVAGMTVRKAITNFTRTDNNASETVLRVNIDGNSKTFPLAVNIYECDLGFVRVTNGNPVCMPSSTRAYILNPAHATVKNLRGAQSRELENQGGGRRGIIDEIFGLAVSDPRAHGKIAY
jgi:hypothetical protein